MEASLLSPWALVRPSLLLLLHTGPRLVQKVGSSGNRNTCLSSEAACVLLAYSQLALAQLSTACLAWLPITTPQ